VLSELLIRFVVGGLVVSAFALVGDVLRPKTFAGLFGGAPSVALVALGLAFLQEGADYAGLEARSMLAGAVALVVYSLIVCRVLLRRQGRPPVSGAVAAGAAWVAWLAVALGIWAVALR
jgi:uncharacterized protein DUF3147